MRQRLRFDIGRRFWRSSVVVGSLTLALAFGCQKPAATRTEESPPAGVKDVKDKPKAEKAEGTTTASAREILTRMADAYREASSYSDSGTLRLVAEVGAEKTDQNIDFSVALERPNKLRVAAYQVTLTCDGQKIHAALGTIPGQVLDKPAPAKIDMRVFRSDPNLASSIADFAGPPPPLLLLLSDDPMAALLRDAEEPELAEPAQIEGRDCYRLKIKGPEGAVTLYIDQELLLLRRVVYPTESLRQSLEQNGPVQQVSLIADFTGARFDAKIDPAAFGFQIPPTAEIVKFFVPPHTAQLLSKPIPEFKFYDLDGTPVTRESLAGKAAVIDFWATWCTPCRVSLPDLQKVYESYKDNPKIAFYAVSVDDPRVDNKELLKTFEELKVDIPIIRDKDRAAIGLKIGGFPTTLVVDANGVVQYYEVGVNPKLAEVLPEKLDKVLAGENIYEPQLKQYEEQLEHFREYAERLEKSADEPVAPDAPLREEKIPETKPAPESDPATMKLTQLWKSAEVTSPGNIAVIPGKDGSARLAVVESWKSVAEVGLDGKLIASHTLKIADNEYIGNLRTAIGGDGKRYTIAWMISQQRCHVLDENWNLVASYPEDALQNPHSGMADVEVGDLDGDGTLEMFVGYWGVVGVKAVSLEGKPLWSNRSLANVLGMAIGPANDKGIRNLYCTNNTGSVVVLDAQGQRQGDINIPQRMMHWIVAADLRDDKKPLWCGLAAPKMGEEVAVGFSLDGRELWNYPLPPGAQTKPVEPIIAGRLTSEGAGQWILPGPDGSVHILAADGKPVDKFNTGVALQGLATVEIDGSPALIMASEKGLTAWKIVAGTLREP